MQTLQKHIHGSSRWSAQKPPLVWKSLKWCHTLPTNNHSYDDPMRCPNPWRRNSPNAESSDKIGLPPDNARFNVNRYVCLVSADRWYCASMCAIVDSWCSGDEQDVRAQDVRGATCVPGPNKTLCPSSRSWDDVLEDDEEETSDVILVSILFFFWFFYGDWMDWIVDGLLDCKIKI